MSRGHEGCHAARVTAAGGNRQHTTTSEFGSFGYHSDHFHLVWCVVDSVTFSPVFVIPSCSCVRVDTWGEQHPHLGTRHDYSGVDSDYGTQTLSTLLETQRISHHAKGGAWSILSMSGRRRLGASVIFRAS